MPDLPTIRDLLYFDFEKASSLWSQLQWGRLESISVSTEEDKTSGTKIGAGIPKIVDANINIAEGEKRTILETRILHHDLLNRIESILNQEGMLISINKELGPDEGSSEAIREKIANIPYISAVGMSVIEDYQSILARAEVFNELATFIGRSAAENIKASPEFAVMIKQVEELKRQKGSISDRNKKSFADLQIKKLEGEVDKLLQSQTHTTDQWILDGIKLWIKTFLSRRINFRIYPFKNCPSFQILCNLKRDSFVDQDLDHLFYGYGARPNVPLGIFGLITSIPSKTGNKFDPLLEFNQAVEMTKEMNFEKALRNLFGAMEGLENFSTFSRYPNITVHPIAVFQPLQAKSTKPESEIPKQTHMA